MAVDAAPTWSGIVDAADDRDASLVALGSDGRRSLAGVLIGSVAEAVVVRALIVHRRP